MFRPAANKKANGGGNSSASDSDWDTSVDVPVPGPAADDKDKTDNSDDDDDDLPVQPKPKTRSSVAGKEDKTSDGVPYTARGEKAGPVTSASKLNRHVPASASAVHLFDSDSEDASPVPPFAHGYPDAVKKNDDKKKKRSSPISSAKDRKDPRYEMSPTPKIPASMEVAVPKWDDSDAEQQTLRELHTNLKKEKTRQNGNKAARKQIQEGGDNSQSMEHASVAESLKQSREVVGLADKTLMTTPEGANNAPEVKTFGKSSPYQPFIVKNPDGKRFVYHFSEGSMTFYEVVEEESQAVMPNVAEKVEGYIKRGWQEFFSVLRIVTSVFVLLVIEAVSFVTNHIARPLLLGLVTTSGNRLIKPLLAAIFNLILQPFLIFVWNAMSGIRHVSQPLIDILGGFTGKVAALLQAFRLVEVNYGRPYFPNQREIMGSGRMNGGEIV